MHIEINLRKQTPNASSACKNLQSAFPAAFPLLPAFAGTFLIQRLKPRAPNAFIGSLSMSDALDVRYTARLARLNLTEEEVLKFQSQLAHILGYVEKLREVNVEGVEPTAQNSEITNVFRADSERDWLSSEQALSNAPRQANDLFVVPKVIE